MFLRPNKLIFKVTTLRPADMPLLEAFMKEPIKPIETAGIAPTSEQVYSLLFVK